jgi:isoleucyl-tRNA synthetase
LRETFQHPARAIQRLGVFGDWEHPYLTMILKYEAEILRAFAVFVEKAWFIRRKSRSSGALARRRR